MALPSEDGAGTDTITVDGTGSKWRYGTTDAEREVLAMVVTMEVVAWQQW